MNISINSNAPIIDRQNIKIHAPASQVWSVLTGINNWPGWQTSVKKAKLHAALKEGTAFTWSTGGATLKSTIHTCKPFLYFGWTGKTTGAFAIHNWRFETVSDGTLVFVEESLHGFLPSLFKNMFRKKLSKEMTKNLKELKATSEK
jgi:uncharacterized membrane protein